ncbi:MAG: universal stress protein [Bacteroidales bacterium]|jgi:hypothetical protein|nr:universal stress protein [Bacteroidales bacterium]
MSEDKSSEKLNIIALTDFSAYGDAAVRYGGVLAGIFKASLTVISNFSFQPQNLKEWKADGQLVAGNDIWKDEIGHIQSVALDKGAPRMSNHFHRTMDNLSEQDIETFMPPQHFTVRGIYQYAEQTHTIMFVIGVSKDKHCTFFNRKRALRFIRPSRLPVMVVGNRSPEKNVFRHVLLPIDMDRQAKEKMLWAGYFSRFYQSTVHILYPNYKDEFLRQKITDNIAFAKKLYQNLSIDYQLQGITPPPDNIDKYSLSHAAESDASLTVVMMTRYYSLFDFLLGPKEYRLIGNDEGFPVLCINERDDLYVLCT